MPFDFLKPKQRQQQNNSQANNGLGGRGYPTDLLLGELMVKAGVISQAQLDDAVKLSANKHLQLGQMLIMAGNISPRDLQAAVDAQSMLRDRSMDQPTAAKCLKIACKTGMSFADVYRDQIGQRSDSSTNKLGELLLDSHLIDREQFGKAMQRSLATGLPLGRILVLNGAISEHILTESLEIQVRIRDGMLERMEAVTALRAQIGDFDSEELQRQTMPFRASLTDVPRRKGVRLGELLVMAGLLAEMDVMSALEIGLLQEQQIGQVFIAQGFVTPELLDIALELQQKVDQEILQPLEAGQALAKISATGVSVDESIEDFVKPREQVYEPLTFDKMLVLARVISADDIEAALEQVLQSPQLLAQLLLMTNYLEEHTSSAVLQCYSMMSNNFLSQDDAIIALDYCLNKEVERNITFGEALSELGWSATQSLQIHAKNSVNITHIRLQAMLGPEEKIGAQGEDSLDGPPEQAQMSMEDYARSEELAASERNNEYQETAGQDQYQDAEGQAQNQEYAEQQGNEYAEQNQEYVQQAAEPNVASPAGYEVYDNPDQDTGYENQSLDQSTEAPSGYVDIDSEQQAAEPSGFDCNQYDQPSYEQPQAAAVANLGHEIEEPVAEAEPAWEQPDAVAAESYEDALAAALAQAESKSRFAHDEPVNIFEKTEEVAQEDEPYREEFALKASDIVEETEITAPAEPEDVTPQSAASLPGGLMGSLSSLLGSNSEQVSSSAKAENSLGQMMASGNAAAKSAASDGSEADALRDLFSPQNGEPKKVAASSEPKNGNTLERKEHHEELVPTIVETQQAPATEEVAAPSKGLGGLMRIPSTSTAATSAATTNSPEARATDGGATDAGAAASSLSSVLAKASTSQHGAANKFIGGSRANPVSTGALSPLNVPSIDRGNSLQKEEPYNPADLHAIGALGSMSSGGADDTAELLDAVSSNNAESANEGQEAQQSLTNEEVIHEAGEVKPAAKSTSAFAHLVAPAVRKTAEELDVEESNERVEDVVNRFPAEVAGADAPAMPNPTIDVAAEAPLKTTLRDLMAEKPSSDVAPTLREMEPILEPLTAPAAPPARPAAPSAAPVGALSKLTRVPSAKTPDLSEGQASVAPAAVAQPAAPVVQPATPVAQSAQPAQPAAPVAPPVQPVQPATPVAPVVQPAVPVANPAPPPVAPAAVAPAPPVVDNVTNSTESTETKTEVKEALGSALNRLAESYYQQGNYPEAQGLYEKILSLKQQQIGPKNPALGTDLTNLAGVLCIQGKFAQAEPFVRRVVTLIEATEPLDTLKLAGSINTLAGILFQQGKLEECEPLLGRALQLRKDFLGEDVIEVADSLRDYAKLLKKLGRIEEAEKHYLQAKAIVAKRQQAAMTPPA